MRGASAHFGGGAVGDGVREASDAKTTCEKCGVLSPRDYRFCVGCGGAFGKGEVSPRATRDGGPVLKTRRSVRPPNVASGAVASEALRMPERVAVALVTAAVDDAPTAPPSPPTTPPCAPCRRCQGICEVGEGFCKHCGASLRTTVGADGYVDPASRAERTVGPPARQRDLREVPRSEPGRRSERGYPRHARAVEPQSDTVTAHLIVIVEDGSEGTAIELRGRQIDIGSSAGDVVLSGDRYMSPRHARFMREDDDWHLRDLGSLNGIYRRLRKPIALRHGDLVLVGLEVLEFQLVEHASDGLGHAIERGVLLFGSPASPTRAPLPADGRRRHARCFSSAR